MRLTAFPPDVENFDTEEREIYDSMTRQYRDGNRPAAYGKMHPKTAGGAKSLMVSPRLARGLHQMGTAAMWPEGREGTFDSADHQIIDLVLSFDAGHWGVLAFHTILAVAAGVSVDTVEALRDGRDDDLSERTLHLKQMIRDIRDGTMTEEAFRAGAKLFGSERGLIEYAYMVLLLNTHVRLMQLVDEIQISPEEFDELLTELRNGTWQPMPDPVAAAAQRVKTSAGSAS